MPVDWKQVKAFEKKAREYVAKHKDDVRGIILPKALREMKVSIGRHLLPGDKISVCARSRPMTIVEIDNTSPIDIEIGVKIKGTTIWFSLVHCCRFVKE